jgi:HEAT repeat protein
VVGQLGGRSDLPILRILEPSENDPLTRSYVTNALARLGDREALRRVATNLKHERADVRTYAAETVGACKGVAYLPQLVAALGDANLDTRIRAAQSILLLTAKGTGNPQPSVTH